MHQVIKITMLIIINSFAHLQQQDKKKENHHKTTLAD